MFPLHTWLPDAHVEAPTAGSVVLAGVLLKMGTYGFLRFALPLFPAAVADWTPADARARGDRHHLRRARRDGAGGHQEAGRLLVGGAPRLRDARHVRAQRAGRVGRVLQMVNHGLSTGALFLLVGMLYERRHTRRIAEFGGVAKPMPVFAACFGHRHDVEHRAAGAERLRRRVPDPARRVPRPPVVATVATTGVVLAAVYMLWMFRRVMFGPVENAGEPQLIDLDLREKLVLVAMIDPDRLDRRLSRSAAAPHRAVGDRAAARRTCDARAAARGAGASAAARRGSPRDAEERAVNPPASSTSRCSAPIVVVGTGAMLVLLGEVLLSRREDRPRPARSPSRCIGSVLALVSIVSLAAGHLHGRRGRVRSGGRSVVFDLGNPIFQLDPLLGARSPR